MNKCFSKFFGRLVVKNLNVHLIKLRQNRNKLINLEKRKKDKTRNQWNSKQIYNKENRQNIIGYLKRLINL